MLSIIATAASSTSQHEHLYRTNERRTSPAMSHSPALYNGPLIWLILRSGTRAASGTVTAAVASGTNYIHMMSTKVIH